MTNSFSVVSSNLYRDISMHIHKVRLMLSMTSQASSVASAPSSFSTTTTSRAYIYRTSTRAVVEGTFLINDRLGHILFEYGTSYSFIIQEFVYTLSLAPRVLQILLEISLPMGIAMVIKWNYRWIQINLDD